MPWFDHHCHLEVDGAAEAIAAARGAGVDRLLCVGTDRATTDGAVATAAAHPGVVWATAGCHPHEARHGWDWLDDAVGLPGVVAVGEAGLDFHYDLSPRPRQRDAFAAQIELAQRRDLPLVIHTREAWEETFDLLDAGGVPRRTVFHCFTGGVDEAEACLARGGHLSFSGIASFRRAENVQAAAVHCPLDRLLVETDSPYLAPIPHRGRPNQPAWVVDVGRAVADLRRIDVESLAAATWATTNIFYGLPFDGASADAPTPGDLCGPVTHTRRQLLDLLERHELRPSRALGQNFVVDPNTVRRMARLAGVGPGDRVLEIGAGLGSLTLALAETGASVTAVETDRYLLPALAEATEPAGVRLIAGDALHLDWEAVLAGEPHVLVANLPYNVATGLVLDLLAGAPAVIRMLVMVQREVGERLAAGPGSRIYGIPSVKRAWWASARVVATVPATVFVPRPKVDSVLLRVLRRPPPGPDPGPTFALVEAGFAQRRKMLRGSLAGRVTAEAFALAGVAPTARAEELDVTDWLRLATAAAATVVAGTGPSPRDPVQPEDPAGATTVRSVSPGPPEVPALFAPATVVAPAKLTLRLRITGVRADGYHLIDAEMVALELADELRFTEGDGVELVDETGRGLLAPSDDDNLVVRALRLVGATARVTVRKRIPLGAGLGGGSADAAAVLRWAGRLDAGLAARLGADVPFCLMGGARAHVRGIGELLDPLPPVARSFTLLTPPFGCATPAVYRAWDELGGPSHPTNDLEPAALHVEPRLARWRDELERDTGKRPVLAGSGSTWFVQGAHPGPGRIVTHTMTAGVG